MKTLCNLIAFSLPYRIKEVTLQRFFVLLTHKKMSTDNIYQTLTQAKGNTPAQRTAGGCFAERKSKTKNKNNNIQQT